MPLQQLFSASPISEAVSGTHMWGSVKSENLGILVQKVEKQCHCCSAAKLYSTLCNPMNCSRPGFPVLQCLLELAQTHVHWVSDAIQPSKSRKRVLFSSVQSLSRVRIFVTNEPQHARLPIHHQLPEST